MLPVAYPVFLKQYFQPETEIPFQAEKIEKLETEIGEVEADMATPEGASDMALYEKHQKLKKDLDQTVEEWETVSMELEEMQGS